MLWIIANASGKYFKCKNVWVFFLTVLFWVADRCEKHLAGFLPLYPLLGCASEDVFLAEHAAICQKHCCITDSVSSKRKEWVWVWSWQVMKVALKSSIRKWGPGTDNLVGSAPCYFVLRTVGLLLLWIYVCMFPDKDICA